MSKQRQILVTVTYNDLGCIIDTKAEPYEEPDLQPTCNQLATDCISRQAAIDAIAEFLYYPNNWDGMRAGFDLSDWKWKTEGVLSELPSAEPDRSLWFRIGEICVDESKGFISAGRAFEKIRELLREAERRTDEGFDRQSRCD